MTIAAPEYDSAARKPRAIEEFYDLLSNWPLVQGLVERDIKIRYKRSVFGFLWTLINPIAMLIVLSLAFTRVFSADAPGYPFFVIPGLLLWNFISQTSMTVAREVAVGVDLWRRVRLPKSALVVSTSTTGLVNLVLAVIPLILVIVVTGRPIGLALLTVPVTILLTSFFVLGLALLLAAIAVYFPDIADIYNILLPALLFTAPIVYPASVGTTPLSLLTRFNPLTLFVGAFRAPLYSNTAPSAESFLAMTAVGLATLCAGWIVFARSTDDIPYQH
jgi:ABC-2 type transport system permease protein